MSSTPSEYSNPMSEQNQNIESSLKEEQKIEIKDQRKKGWFWIENELIDNYLSEIGVEGLAIYSVLCKYADSSNIALPKQELICKKTGLSEPTVRKFLKILQDYNLITVKRIWKRNRYTVLDKKEWKVITQSTQGSSPKAVLGHINNKNQFNKNNIISKDIIAESKDSTNELISLFKPVNPSYKTLFSNKTQRSALERLVKEVSYKKVKQVIELLPQITARLYSPRITTPLQLEEKFGQLQIFLIQENNRKPNLVVIS